MTFTAVTVNELVKKIEDHAHTCGVEIMSMAVIKREGYWTATVDFYK